MSFIVILILIFGPYCEGTLLKKDQLLQQLQDVPSADSTLLLAHIFFRHGAKLGSTFGYYPNDPYKYASFFPRQIGDLTREGELTSYKLGLELRKRYDTFLGRAYYPDLIGAFTSATRRTQNSLECTLAGLFPPQESEQFLADLAWRPIAYTIIPMEKEEHSGVVLRCKNFSNFTSYPNPVLQDMYDYISYHSGLTIRNTSGIFFIHQNTLTLETMGWRLPDWLAEMYPEPMNTAIALYQDDVIRYKLRQGVSGMLRTVIQNSKDKLSGTLKPPRRKLFLYSGHEFIFLILAAVEAYTGQLLVHSAYIAIELHHINDTMGFKIYLQNYNSNQPESVNIFNQGEFCPLDVFLEKTHWIVKDPKPQCL